MAELWTPATPTETGAVARLPGFGQYFAGSNCALVPTAGRNIVSNPRGGAGATTGWTPTSASVEAVADELAPFGSYLKFTANGGGFSRISTNSIGANATTLAQGTRFPVTVWMRALNAGAVGAQLTCLLWETGGVNPNNGAGSGNAITLTEDWQQAATLNGTIAEADRTGLEIYIGDNGNTELQAGDEVGVFVQVEEGQTYHSPYIDGSLGSGFAWEGTAHESASTRAAGLLSVTPEQGLSTREGAAIVWLRSTMASSEMMPGSDPATVLQIVDGSGQLIRAMFMQFFGGFVQQIVDPSSGGAFQIVGDSFSIGATRCLYVDWTEADARLAINGGAFSTTARTYATDWTSTGAVHLGHSSAGANQGNWLIAGAAVFDRRLRAGEWENIAALGRLPYLGERVGDAMISLIRGGEEAA